MRPTATKLTILAAAVLTAASAARAGSLWAKGHRRAQAIYTDDTARCVGDVLTITIDEKTTIANETSRELDKSQSVTGSSGGTLDLANLVGAVGQNIFDFPKLDLSASLEKDFEGGANYDADRSVTDKISVVVQDVLPNGNLVVLGSRTRTVAGDTQVIQVSGIVRPSDVSFDNEVDSERVAEFRIVFASRGQENHYVNPGWLVRLWNAVSPF
jgi:flagellar L-ring protein precursor FlgH